VEEPIKIYLGYNVFEAVGDYFVIWSVKVREFYFWNWVGNPSHISFL